MPCSAQPILPIPIFHSPAQHRGKLTALCMMVATLAAIAWAPSAGAVGLGNLDIRSYLGEPLNVRIGVIAQANEEIESDCFTLVNSAGNEVSVNRRDARLTLVETKNSRYIEVRGNTSFNEPIGRLSIRAGCKGESGIVRDYSLLLDPPPLLAPPLAASNQAASSTPLASAQTPRTGSQDSARWTVYAGDTLSSLASAIHPNSRARQAQYIAALRSLNPALATIADNVPLPLQSQLVLPDLKTLSAVRPSRLSVTTPPQNVASDDPSPAKVSKRKRRNTRADSIARGSTPATATRLAASADLPIAVGASVDKNIATPSSQSNQSGKGIQPKKSAPVDGFKLRISGSEIDLSRSQGVTDEARAQLRERFAFLDADDQTAQLLALKNNVKQIEKRLNELQLKMATLPLAAAPPATSAAASAVTSTVTPAVTAPVTAPITAPIAAPLPPTATASTEAAPLTPAAVAKPVEQRSPKTSSSNGASDNPTTWLIAALSAFALAALAWWGFKKRRHERAANHVGNDLTGSADNASKDEFNKWANDPETASPDDTLSAAARMKNARELKAKQHAARARYDEAEKAEKADKPEKLVAAPANYAALDTAGAFKSKKRFADLGATPLAAEKVQPTAQPTGFIPDTSGDGLFDELVDAPYSASPIKSSVASFTSSFAKNSAASDAFTLPVDRRSRVETPAQPSFSPQTGQIGAPPAESKGAFNLDLDLNEHTLYPSNSGDQTSEDRLRRLRYMQERYPELTARTVSIDEPESVIHAARLYFEENQLGKACELLIYAVEERPQEIRFWLAQFELFRLEKMSRQFADLADKFQLLFGHTEAWPKVSYIGYGLDPANPLFASAHDNAASEKIDMASENWLHAPVGDNTSTEHISQALVADLRASLFAEHRVSHADFAGGPDLLNESGKRG